MVPKKREKSTRLEVLLIAVEEDDKEDQPQSPFHNLHDKKISSFRYSSEDNRQEEEVPQQETPLPIKKKKVAKTKQSGNIAPLRKLAMLGALNQKAGF